MSRSRWGGFRRGLRLFRRKWEELEAESSEGVSAPADITEFNYKNAQGIWNLNSTVNLRGEARSSATYTVGFSDSLDTISGESASWQQRTVDISDYSGATVRLVFNYKNGSGFRGDLQLDAIALDGTTYSFENTGDSFQTSASGESTYAGVSWQTLSTGTTNARWNVDSGGTPSGSTGLTSGAVGSYYIYAETSSPADEQGYNFWLRSPQVTLGSSPTLTYYVARSGSNIGSLGIYLDVIA